MITELLEDTKVRELNLTTQEQEREQLVLEKKKNDMFQVAFCGHFSAGKSTLLNTLLGADMLPTSPIPTSANIIGIKNGNFGLNVVTTEGEKKNWEGEIPWQRVREWGMDGAAISSITISAPLAFLGNHSMIYDTPGVDSTDPTHQAVTLEALYTTDFIVYVMDYNHVQSETNLTFLKQLSDEKKPLYLVVNQVDKHDERELSFEAFDRSIRDTLKNWNINIMKLRYTSMKVKDHKHNQVRQFLRDMQGILYYGNELLPYTNQRLQQALYLSVANRIEEEKEEELEEIKEQLQASGFSLKQFESSQHIHKQFETSKAAKQLFETEFEEKWGKLVKGVTLFPYTTTELARNWIESIEPNFKVGFLFSKKKTKEEQERRLTKLVEETNDKIKSQLEFHIHKVLQEYDLSLLTNREEVEREIADLHLTVKPGFFKEAVHSGPKNREYVFTFTKDRTNEIIKILRSKAQTVIQLIAKGMEQHWLEEQQNAQKELGKLANIQPFIDKMEQVSSIYDRAIETYRNRATVFQDAGKFEQVLYEMMEKQRPVFQTETTLSSITLPETSVIETDWTEDVISDQTFDEEEANNWVNKLQTVLEKFVDEEHMNYERNQLEQRLHRFKQQTFTISLFGAFSAGKSSFANALLGDHVLPVSPHPTTATVNIVKQPEEGHPSRTAKIKVKSKDQLNEEIKSVAEQLDANVTLETISAWKAKGVAMTTWQKTYEAYLTTLKTSLSALKWELGSEFEVTLEELQPFVANESDACLIEQVTLYYDSPLTRNGIILVDTPGVNSIHGRHTNVAFKQLRESDAIFYLSYYNHAFSKADQLFLQQMAKVNEGFRSDKLYFILNAADLASSEVELNGVRKHVYDQLVHSGIEKPRLYPLSSKKGLLGKKTNREVDPLFIQFETAFYSKTIMELKKLSYDLLVEEVKQYSTILLDGISIAQSKESEKEQKSKQLKLAVLQWEKNIDETNPATAFRKSQLEVSQLFLYLRERISYVLRDQFSDTVNVTTVTGKTKKAQQDALRSALKEWRSEGEHFIKQELQATFVRLETALNQSIHEWFHEMLVAIRHDFPSYSARFTEKQGELTVDLNERFIPLSLEEYTTYFQSLKSFFEQGSIKKLKDDIVQQGTDVSSQALRQLEKTVEMKMEERFDSAIMSAKEELKAGLMREIERFKLLTDPKRIDSLKDEQNSMNQLL